MGGGCSLDRLAPVEDKKDIFDFRYRDTQKTQKKGVSSFEDEDKETEIPDYKDHLRSLRVDPYEDRYANKGGSVFVMGQKIQNKPQPQTNLKEPVKINPVVNKPIKEPDSVFVDPPKPVTAPAKTAVSVHIPKEPVVKCDVMNEMSKKSKEVEGLVKQYERRSNIDDDFNEVHGPYRYPNKDTYHGQYLNGKRQGFGTEISIYGDKYIGQWDRDMKEGHGRFILFNGDFYEGMVKNGEYHGQGQFIDYENKVISEGEFRDGLLNGKGKEEYPDGNKYEGDFKNGEKHGKGVFTFKDGSVYSGEFLDGIKHGKGEYLI